jgi:DNA-directed RNA polymerase subunit beta
MEARMHSTPETAGRTVRFSSSHQVIPIPNLIQVQKKSYDDFLQMDLLPAERRGQGLQAVFGSVFPFANFKDTCSIDFVAFGIGDWQCRCGVLKGLEHMRHTCPTCAHRIRIRKQEAQAVLCPECGTTSKYEPSVCEHCGYPINLQLPYTPEECIERGLSYSAPLRVTFRLYVHERTPEGEKRVKDIKEEEVYFGEVPLMTDTGTFVINGTERVVVSQLHRSPGVFFTKEGPHYFMAKVIPYRGSWVEFEYDKKGILYVRIDRRRKFLGTVFLRCMGLASNESLLRRFLIPVKAALKGDGATLTFDRRVLEMEEAREKERSYSGQAQSKRLFAGIKWDKPLAEELAKKGQASRHVKFSALSKARFVSDVVDMATGEILFEANDPVPANVARSLEEHDIKEFELCFPQWDLAADVLVNTLEKDDLQDREPALLEFYRRMRPGDPPTKESATTLFRTMFLDEKRYDFSRVGRFKFNIKFSVNTNIDEKILSAEDFFKVVEYLFRLRRDIGHVDDIDNLGNRRVRAVGELLENHFRIGLVRMEKAVKEKMYIMQEIDAAMPRDLINAKPVMASIKEFFGSSQLSQFMDQTNPLAEITHKRRLSALGPGGLSRERAGFEVRDVHATHYSRICPIETPEGPNIGLISSLATYARVNEFGFLESPYKEVRDSRVINHVTVVNPGDSSFKIGQRVEEEAFAEEVKRVTRRKLRPPTAEPYIFYLSAWDEEKHIIAQANVPLDAQGRIMADPVIARFRGEFITAEKKKVDYIDVSPMQVVSVAAALIPFLEHDDANRALMGSNMQRQAVPLISPEAPTVLTGMEGMVARDSGAVVICRRSGIVEAVDAERVIVRVEGEDPVTGEVREFGADIYQLVKFKRSNQNTCITQRPIVAKGQRVDQGQVLADGASTDGGVLAQGRNILVALMPFRGYNFEDAILISEKVVKEDAFTSIHIEEFECEARDTKLGPEIITCDIPNVGEAALKDLDESGIVRIGAHVRTDDILVGKITPKGETQLTPEEKLLRAIFGEKAGDFRDASLRVPPGIEGVVVSVRIFYRKGVPKDQRAVYIEDEFRRRLERNLKDQERIIIEERNKKIHSLVRNLKAVKPVGTGKKPLLDKGKKFTLEAIVAMGKRALDDLPINDVTIRQEVRDIVRRTDAKLDILRKEVKDKVENLHKGEELSPGVIKKVKVYVAMKRKLSVGDKMAGRHGNKGVISRILPEEDMPFLPDGTPVEIILNPLGVPSRMNVGQILETHLGWAGKMLGLTFETPVFEGANEGDIKAYLAKAKLPNDSKTVLVDGITGEPFDNSVTVGFIYMMKLVHLVDDKLHARSIGPYSLITQQPLGGKAQFGGQRFGEMEVWALEAYGAAFTLQELLTFKSDDVEGRTRIYQAIVKGQVPQDPGIPESFNVLIKELRSLCLDVDLLKV